MVKESPGWTTAITKVEPNRLLLSGYPIEALIEGSSLLETAHLLLTGELPAAQRLEASRAAAVQAALAPAPAIGHPPREELSMTLARFLLSDTSLATMPDRIPDERIAKVIHALGRLVRYLARIFGSEAALDSADPGEPFCHLLDRAASGRTDVDPRRARMLEAIAVATADHGLTPPSTQVSVMAATTRAGYEMAIAGGVGAMTDVHGGAGARAAEFLKECAQRSEQTGDPSSGARAIIAGYLERGERIAGLGHRFHTEDPRCGALRRLAASSGLEGRCLALSEVAAQQFAEIAGRRLPVNVDGVIGAIIADLGFDTALAKALFIFGRVAGLSAHYYEERCTRRPMRHVDFSAAVFAGQGPRRFPSRS